MEEFLMSVGFIYVLINPTMPGLAKIGKTTRDPSDRVAELSSPTGVPSPFILAFEQPVADCDSAEIWIHNELTRQGHRHADNREFFNAPLHEIIRIVSQAANFSPQVSSVTSGDVQCQSDATNLAEELYELACQHDKGSDNILKNQVKALALYEQAAALGHVLACSEVAWRYEFGPALENGPKIDKEKALSYLNKAVQLGCWDYQADIAELFFRAGQRQAVQAHWYKFFLSACQEIDAMGSLPSNMHATYRRSLAVIGLKGWKYCRAVAMKEIEGGVPDQMLLVTDEYIREYINEYIRTVSANPDPGFVNDMTNRLQVARNYLDRIRETTCSAENRTV
jgi:hypothetical protein